MASPPDRNAGTQMTVEVLKSFCRSSVGLDDLHEEVEESEELVPGHLRRRNKVSETPSPPLSPVPPSDDTVFLPQRGVQELFDMLNTSAEQLTPGERETAKKIGDRLKILGDNMDKTMTKEIIKTVFMHPGQEIQDAIKTSLRELKTVTAKTVVKVLQLGLQLFLSAPPSAQLQQETPGNESQIAENIVELIIEEITALVTENGGWDQVLNATDQPSSPSRPHSSSTPSLPQVSPTGSSSDFERSWRSQSFSVSRPVPIRPRQLHLSEPNSVPSSPTTRGRSMSSSLVTIGAAAFGLALMHYLQS